MFNYSSAYQANTDSRCVNTGSGMSTGGSTLARRASPSLAGDKRGMSERSELSSACQGLEAQSSRGPRQQGALFFALFLLGTQKKEGGRGAPAAFGNHPS